MSERIVVYEDRPQYLVGVKLLVLSLERHWPAAEVAVTCPGAPEAFVAWLAGRPRARLYPAELEANGWDVKPSLLLAHLRDGAPSAVWIDADVIVAADLASRLAAEPIDAIVSTEDVWWGRGQGSAERTTFWGFEPGRIPPRVANTALVRVSREHEGFLREWQDMLSSADYRRAQTSLWTDRPLFMAGDQEAFTALLGARQWQGVDRRLMRRGIDIAQCYSPGSFAPWERAVLVWRGQQPFLVHAMGPKPWVAAEPGGGSRRGSPVVQRLHAVLSPYVRLAAQYRDDLDEDASWIGRPGRRLPGAVGRARFNPCLPDLPLSLIDAAGLGGRILAGRARRVLGRSRWGPRS